MLEILFILFIMKYVSAEGGADVVLSCSLVEEGGGMGGMGGGGLFTRSPATLVLRDLAVTPDLSPETLTPFVPPPVPDPDNIIIEAKASAPEIPEADLLLHADCNEQEVTCEISRYFPRGSREEDASKPAYFIGSLQVEGGGLSLTLILQVLAVEASQSDPPPLIHTKLELPLGQSGTLLTEVVFLVFSRSPSISAPLEGVVLLDCGFRQQDPPPGQEVGLEWQLQHHGSGRRVLDMKVGQEGPVAVLHVERRGFSVDDALLVGEGNASASLSGLKVSDEGIYICSVSAGIFRAQQAMQLHVTQPPRVSLSEDRLVFQDMSALKLSCHCKRYYPLDAQVEWLFLAPTHTEPALLPDQGSLSSHRQHSDGTFSLSSHVTLLRSALPPGTTLTCRVSHKALATPLDVSLTVEAPAEPDSHSYWMVLGFLVVTALFFYQVVR